MASDTGFDSWNAFVYICGSYHSKNIAKCKWSVHLRFGLHPQDTGIYDQFSTVFDPPQLHERDATEQHIWPDVYLADALMREPIRIVRAQPAQTVARPKHGDASLSHGTFLPAALRATIL